MSTAGKIGGDNTPLTAKEAAAYLGVPYKRFLEMRETWGIPVYYLGREVMTRRRHLDNFIEKGGSTATADHRTT